MVKIKRQRVSLFKKNRRPAPIVRKGNTGFSIKTAARFLSALIILSIIGFVFVRIKYMFVDSDYFIIKGVDAELYDWEGILHKTAFNELKGKDVIGKNIFFIDLNGLKEQIELEHPEPLPRQYLL